MLYLPFRCRVASFVMPVFVLFLGALGAKCIHNLMICCSFVQRFTETLINATKIKRNFHLNQTY